MIPQTKKYFIVLVHHGDPKPTDRLVENILSSPAKINRVLVIDHGLSPYHPAVSAGVLQVVRPEKNSGYAGGLNVGLGALYVQGAEAADIVICMNNDVVLAPSTLTTLQAWWNKHSAPAIAGAKLGYVNLLTGRTTLARSSSLVPRSLLPYIHGSFFSAPVRVLMQLKGLPSDNFLYWEDVAFSQRAHKAGIPLAVISHLDIAHEDSVKLRYTDEQVYYLVRNGARFLSQETGAAWRLGWKLANHVRLAYHSIWRQNRQTPVIRQALKDAIQNQSGPWL